jgi:hypothetical protein
MPYLDKNLRRQLAAAIQEARTVAEEGASDAIRRLGVAEDKAPPHVVGAAAELRVKLRAHARSLGDAWDADRKWLLSTDRLVETAAFEHWHRMLFGRFLVERGLLVHPDLGVAIARNELAELAAEEKLPDEWALVERIAAPALPAVFKPDDPVLAMTLAPEFSKQLRDIVVGLRTEVFTADDSLGWTYQFWRAAEKDAVNKSGVKIGSQELPAVTQLFTEHYMVQFLLHNTLGAWWSGKVLAENPALASDAEDEDALRAACSLPDVTWDYLRFVRDGEAQDGPWRPAAGTFPGWPTRAAEITFCDPCCGSGHFLTEGFAILVALRQYEEGLSSTGAVQAVLRDNLHGLELDGRCVQIAAFNVALVAWKLAGEPIVLPAPHIAWVGAPPPMSKAEMAALGNGDLGLRRALEALHDQFANAPTLGSLLEVGARNLLDVDLRERGEAAFAKLRRAEPERAEGAIAARGLMDAAALLARRWTLQTTNVPFLGKGKQGQELASYISAHFPKAQSDLATAMLERLLLLCDEGGSLAAVTKGEWCFLSSSKKLRKLLLKHYELSFLVTLGEEAWEAFGKRGPLATLCVFNHRKVTPASIHAALDLTNTDIRAEKIQRLTSDSPCLIKQSTQISNPDSRITVTSGKQAVLLSRYARSLQGISPADTPRYGRFFWESVGREDYVYWQSAPEAVHEFRGRELTLHYAVGLSEAIATGGAYIRGEDAWGRDGVAVRQLRDLSCTLYTGNLFDTNVAVIVPFDASHLPAIWTFCSSSQFRESVRRIDLKKNVTNATMVKVPFDLEHWQRVASERYPHGLPDPYSDDPTQWVFHGHPRYAKPGTELHVALARLAGFRWPAQSDKKIRIARLAQERTVAAANLPEGDGGGILPLQATANRRSLADQMRSILAAAYGSEWSNAREQVLVRSSDFLLDTKEAKNTNIEDWLLNRAFRQHCILFSKKGEQRPFLWHVWDAHQDGFSAFLNYHCLDRAALEKLTHTLLGDWIVHAKAESDEAREGKARQLQQKLMAIIAGEKPYDIFVRWKSLTEQPVGWEPDLDDGARLNIRPFMTAGILREQPKGINWNKDRGTDVESAPWHYLAPKYGGKEGDRINDHHLPLAEKRDAQKGHSKTRVA